MGKNDGKALFRVVAIGFERLVWIEDYATRNPGELKTWIPLRFIWATRHCRQ